MSTLKNMKILDFNRIRTRIAGLEGKKTDYLTDSNMALIPLIFI